MKYVIAVLAMVLLGCSTEVPEFKTGSCWMMQRDQAERWDKVIIVKIDEIGINKVHYVFWSNVHKWMTGEGMGSDLEKERFARIYRSVECPE